VNPAPLCARGWVKWRGGMKKIKNLVLNNKGLKILSLFLAVVIWFYIIGELNRLALESEMGIRGHIPYKIIAKPLQVVPDIRGKVPQGYLLDEDKIMVTPQICNVIGSKRLLDKVSFIKTIPINISEYRKTATIRVSVEPPFRGLKIIDRFVTVVVPIEKTNKN
jgi:hypothetical protein